MNKFIFTMWSLVFLAKASLADIIMTPYLQAPTKNGVQIVAECNSTTTATVEYGRTTSYGNSSITEKYEITTGGTYAHSIRLTGLQSNTVYHYHVKQGGSTSPDATFRTAPLPGTPFRFAWLSDNRGNQSQYDAILGFIKAANPALIIHGGDIATDGAYANIKSEFFTPAALSIYSHIPFVLTIGNHEQWTQDPMAFVEAPISASNTQDYYSLDYGDMHLLVMLLYTGENTYYDTSPTSVQYAFAQADLMSTKQQWKIVIAHKVPYTSADPNGGGHPESPELFPITQGVYEPNKVDAWIGGHNHFYQHNLVNGIHYVIIGTCAAELYVPSTASYTLKSVQDYCYGIIDVSPSDFKISVYNGNGNLIDTIMLHKNSIALAVQLSSFTVTRLSPTSSRLEWKTIAETNNYGFTIVRGVDSIAFVPGAGTTNVPQTYSYVDNASSQSATYRLKQINLDGTFAFYEPTARSGSIEDELSSYVLNQNYPNPFNPTTAIAYTLKEQTHVKLCVVDILGRVVSILVDENQVAGQHRVTFSGENLPSGVYMYHLVTANFTQTKRMSLLK
jgi:hypothetical protein